MFDFELDDVKRIIRVTTAGFWNVQETKEFVASYRNYEKVARARWNCVRYLVDARESAVQSAEVLKEMDGLHRTVEGDPRDRVAIVVGTSLVKMQTKRAISGMLVPDSESQYVFISMSAAETWLCAWE